MQVKELVEKLQKLDQDQDILIQSRDGESYSYDINDIVEAYIDQGESIIEYDVNEETPFIKCDMELEDTGDLSKEQIEFIETNDPVYIIKPE